MRKIPLTHEQKLFAEEHHGLVYKFLHANRLPEDEFYDVIVFGYLKAVQDYLSKPELQQYAFSTICWQLMSRTLNNYYKSQSCQKRNAEVISIHLIPREESLPLEQTLSKQDDLMMQLETKLLLHDLAKRISRQQMDMVHLKSSGYGIREIAHSQKVTMKQVKEVLEQVRQVLTELCYE